MPRSFFNDMTTFTAWIQATRPKTLFAALAPITMGLAMALADGVVFLPALLWALIGAVGIQIGTNFCNDYFDDRQGADTDARQGPKRGLQLGLITAKQMLLATVVSFVVAGCACAMLVARAGWPLVVVGVASLLSGIFYTAGRKSLAYTGMADVFVLIFFGPVAVGGTYFVQALSLPWYVLLAGLGPGFLSTSLLTVNNLRDVDEDRQNRKLTLAVRFGRTFSRREYAVCLFAALLCPVVAGVLGEQNYVCVLMLGLLIPASPLMRKVRVGTTGAELNPVLGKTGKLLMIYSIWFFIVWNLPSWI